MQNYSKLKSKLKFAFFQNNRLTETNVSHYVNQIEN